MNLKEIIEKYEDLTANGFETSPNEDARAYLTSEKGLKEIKIVNDWLETVPSKFRKTINKSITSYELKHICENDFGDYITNGALIVGMLMNGFRMKKCGNSTMVINPNAFFNISLAAYNQDVRDGIDFCVHCGCSLGNGGCEYCKDTIY